MRIITALLIGMALMVPQAWGDSTIFQRTASPNVWDSTYDAFIDDGTGDTTNYGGYTFLNMQKSNRRRALIVFPNIDQHASFDADDCDSCFLDLKLSFVLQDSTDLKVTAYKVDEYWTEGVATGAPWDDSNYVSSKYRNDSTLTTASHQGDTAWSTFGGDYSTVLDTVGVAEVIDVWYRWTISKAVCSTWVASPSTNYGMLLKFTDETGGDPHRYWYSSENATVANRPKLVVYWTTRAATAVTEYGASNYGKGLFGK